MRTPQSRCQLLTPNSSLLTVFPGKGDRSAVDEGREGEMENLQYAAGIMFWALVDFVLGGIWLAIIAGVIQRIVKGMKHD